MENLQKPLMRTIRCTYKLWADYMRSVAAECGVPDSYRVVLSFLLRHPGASQKDIAAYRDITTASVSQIVKEMQLTGYLKKEQDPDDRRYVKLYLTEKGEACARELHDRTKRADERIRELFSPEKEQEMLGLLEELSVVLKEKLPEEDSETGKSEREELLMKKTDGEDSVTEKSEREKSLMEKSETEKDPGRREQLKTAQGRKC
ncbi:MAG: MarR family winged helix-turn-helix transcriptional regulator [Lachnospiraceae bacterium]|nr:MarR family winged helix-turn-helix transcriptional regulator [Lachnospiraceae bacterium]